MKRITRRAFTPDFKAQAIALAESMGVTKAARQLDMSDKTLSNWLCRSNADKPVVSSKRATVSELESELRRLKAENETLKMEREILKKATAFFAKESK